MFVTGESVANGASAAGYATIAYDTATGARLWAARYNGPGNGEDRAFSAAVSPADGTVVVTGESAGAHTLFGYATVAYRGWPSVQGSTPICAPNDRRSH